MDEKLPVLISIPHGGLKIPKELKQKTLLRDRDIFDDGDALTPEIYDLGERVYTVVRASIARAFVDLNRAPWDRPPENPDGVVKTQTVNGKKIYQDDHKFSSFEITSLIDQYHRPYHLSLEQASQINGLELALDCHSMLDRAPMLSSDPGAGRPLFCLSNCGGSQGYPTKDFPQISCPPEYIRKLAACIQTAFEVDAGDVLINDPFHGGYITSHHGRKNLAWVQLEMNRRLYLASPWFDPVTYRIDPKRLIWLKDRFYAALNLYFERK